MIMNIEKYEHIKTIQRMLNIDKNLAEKIYNEAGTDVDKIYASLKTINVKENIGNYTKCLRCGRALKTPESRICGYGAICKDKVSKSNGKLRKKSLINSEVYSGTNSRAERFGGGKY